MEAVTQLTLGLKLCEDATFSNFLVSAENQQLINQLKKTAMGEQGEFIYVSGPASVGKSHLLQACCHLARLHGLTTAYLPLIDLVQQDISILEALEHLNFIAIDDIHAIKNSKVWQEALMYLYNRARGFGAVIVFSSNLMAQELNLSLPDLSSRLMWGLQYFLYPLSDEDKLRAIQLRAEIRGFSLSDEVGSFLLRRCSREMIELVGILEKLDHASLSAHRKLTIPFVKHVLSL